MAINVKVARSDLPVVWLDTSILFKMSRVLQGKVEPDEHRIIAIRDKIHALTSSNQMLCPEANQSAENFGSPGQFSKAFMRVSRGVRTRRPIEVQLRQEICAMRAYLANNKNVQIGIDTLFNGNPVSQLKEANSSRFLIDIEKQKNEELVAKLKIARANTHKQLEELRLRNRMSNVSIDEQLEREHVGDVSERIRQFLDISKKLESGEDFDLDQFFACQSMFGLLTFWRKATDSDTSSKSLGEFLRSEHYRAVPANLISSRMMANLLTGSRKIKHGDAMDISHISSILPYADIMIVDTAMKNLIFELDLPKLYGTACFSLSDHADIIRSLDCLSTGSRLELRTGL